MLYGATCTKGLLVTGTNSHFVQYITYLLTKLFTYSIVFSCLLWEGVTSDI